MTNEMVVDSTSKYQEDSSGKSEGMIIHVYEDRYPQCFCGRIEREEYKPERFAGGKQDHSLDHHGKGGHFDPEWDYFTYEDLPSRSPKARLRDLDRDDYIFFNCTLRQCENLTIFEECRQEGGRGKVAYSSRCLKCKKNGAVSWYIIGFFKLKEKPKTTGELIESGKIMKNPYKHNACVKDESYMRRISERYIFAGSRDGSRRFTYPFALPINGTRYGIRRKKLKGSVHWRLSHVYRSVHIEDDGLKKLLSDIERN